MQRWLYALQTKLALTPAESGVLLAVGSLFLLGLFGKEVQERHLGFDPDTAYVETDSVFFALSRQAIVSDVARADTTEADTLDAPDGPSESPETARAASAPSVRMNLNTASARQLTQLPGIGPKLAARIITDREANGPFSSVAQLTRVKGIGKKKLAKFESRLFVDDG